MKKIIVLLLILLLALPCFGQYIINKNYKSLPWAWFHWANEVLHATVAAYDSSGIIFAKDGSDEWYMKLFDSDGNENFFLNVDGDITVPDDMWFGLGAAKGRIEFDDQATDEVNILDANLHLSDDKKLYFGTGNDFFVEYDEDGNDIAQFAGKDIGVDNKYFLSAQNFSDIAANGAGYWFDGVDDDIVKSDDADLDFAATGDFTVEMIIKPLDVTRTTDYLINKEAGGVGWGLYINQDDLYIRIDDNSNDASGIIGTAVLANNVIAHVVVVFDRSGSATAYINGESVGTVVISAVTATLENAGDLHIANDSANGNEFKGEIYLTGVHSCIYTAAEVKALQNGPLPYKYLGASQTELVTNGDFGTGDGTGWTEYGAAIATEDYTGNELTVTITSGGAKLYASTFTMDIGKRYRLKFTVRDYSTGSSAWVGAEYSDASDIQDDDGNIARLQANGSVDMEFTATVQSTGLNMGNDTYDNGDVFTIDDVSLVQIGCVGQWEPDAIASGFWFDKSGNALNGTVSGAIDIGRQYPMYGMQHAADPDAGTDDTYTMALDPVPYAYQIGMIVTLTVTTANTGACTVDVNGLGVKNIKVVDGGDPQNGDISATGVFILVYDGTSFILTNPETTTTS